MGAIGKLIQALIKNGEHTHYVYASISFYSIHCLFLIQFHYLCVLARLAREIFSVRFIKDIPWLSLSLSHFVKCIYLKTIAVDTYQVVLFPLRVYLYSLKWKFATSVIKFSLLILWVVYCFTRLCFFSSFIFVRFGFGVFRL